MKVGRKRRRPRKVRLNNIKELTEMVLKHLLDAARTEVSDKRRLLSDPDMCPNDCPGQETSE